MISEALPDPAPGPERDALAADGAARVERAVAMMENGIHGYIMRVSNVLSARMRGPKARKGTRWWVDGNPETASVATKTFPPNVEMKALDPGYVLPQRTLDELADAVRPVGLRIVADAASAVAKSLGRPNTGLAALDWKAIESTVDDVVRRMLDVNERLARDVRTEILHADATAESLDEAINRVMEAVKRGGRWLLLSGRTLATALAGDATLAAARAQGCTYTTWISQRDPKVRETHRAADGQRRRITDKYQVGAFRLRFPGDPLVLPAGWSVVAGCRCFLAPVPPSREFDKAVQLAEQGTPAAARRLLSVATRPDGPVMLGAPELRTVAVPEISASEPVVGYRALDAELPVTPGQQVTWPGGALALALAPPAAAATVLAVAIPAGAVVGVSGGGITLPSQAALTVVSVSDGQVVAVPAAA